MTVTDVRTLLKNVVEAHATHNTFYSIWSVAKDRASELEYPCVIWDQWRSRLVDDPQGYLHRSVLVRLLIITSVPTDRTPLERDQAVEAADNAASDIVLKIRKEYRDLELSNISTTTMFDEYTQLETGVLLTFTLMGDGLCLDQNQFPGTNCPTFAELISALSWSEIKADMSEQQIAEATEDLGGEDATAKVNGTTYGTVAPGDDIDIQVVRASDNSAIGTVTPGVSVSIPSGRAMTTNGLVEVVSVPPGVDVPLPQSVINYQMADGLPSPTPLGPYNTLYSAGTLKGGAAPRFVVRRASDGTTIIATGDIANPFVELSPQVVKDTNGATIATHEVNEPAEVPDSVLTLPDGSPGILPASSPFDIRTLRSGIVYAVNEGMFSGELRPFLTGDERWAYVNGLFTQDYPAYPAQFTRLVDFSTLADNNIYGNANRFTDDLGTQVYAARIVLDHFTGIAWYSPGAAMNGTWNVAVGACRALTVGGHTDWVLPPLGILRTIINNSTNIRISYAPFGIDGQSVHSSTTNPSSTANSLPMQNSGAFQSAAKTASARYIACRRFAN